MGKNKNRSGKDATRAAVEQARLRRQQTERRNRLIMIAVVVVLFLAAAGTIVAIIWKTNQGASPKNDPKASTQLTGDITKDMGIVIGKEGVGKPTAGAKQVDLFFDYSCPGCIMLEVQHGKMLEELAGSGAINLVLRPVLTHDMPWAHVATDAAVKVASKDPAHFKAFHDAMETNAMTLMQEEQKDKKDPKEGVMGDLNKSFEKIREIAATAKVSPEVIATFSPNGADESLKTWTQAWVDGKYSPQPGTPMLVKDGIMVSSEVVGGSAEELKKALSS